MTYIGDRPYFDKVFAKTTQYEQILLTGQTTAPI